MARFSFKELLGIIKNTFGKFFDDKGMKLSASLAYYTVLSLPALLILIIGLGSIFYGRDAIQGELFHGINDWIGEKPAAQVQVDIPVILTPYSGYVDPLGVLI